MKQTRPAISNALLSAEASRERRAQPVAAVSVADKLGRRAPRGARPSSTGCTLGGDTETQHGAGMLYGTAAALGLVLMPICSSCEGALLPSCRAATRAG